MRTISLALGLLFLAALAATAAEPAAPAWSLPKADGEKWVRRVQALTRDGWKASLRGNKIVLAREKPVRFVRILPNAGALVPGETRETPTEEGPFRLTLRFGSRMSLDEYERLAAVNAASEREKDRLHAAVAKLPQKFDQILATTDQEKQLVREYEAAVAKLPWHDLPDLYSDSGFSSPATGGKWCMTKTWGPNAVTWRKRSPAFSAFSARSPQETRPLSGGQRDKVRAACGSDFSPGSLPLRLANGSV